MARTAATKKTSALPKRQTALREQSVESAKTSFLTYFTSPQPPPQPFRTREQRMHDVLGFINTLRRDAEGGDDDSISRLHEMAYHATLALSQSSPERLQKFAHNTYVWPILMFGREAHAFTEQKKYLERLGVGGSDDGRLARLSKRYTGLKGVAFALLEVLQRSEVYVRYKQTTAQVPESEMHHEVGLRSNVAAALDCLRIFLPLEKRLHPSDILDGDFRQHLKLLVGTTAQDAFPQWFSSCKALLMLATSNRFSDEKFGLRQYGEKKAERRAEQRTLTPEDESRELPESGYREDIIKHLRAALHHLVDG